MEKNVLCEKEAAVLFQSLLDSLITIRSSHLCYPEDFCAFSDVAEEWSALETRLSALVLDNLKNLENNNEVNNG